MAKRAPQPVLPKYVRAETKQSEAGMCLRKEFRVVVPNACLNRCPETVGDIRNAVHKAFGGTTSVQAVGTWKNDVGEPAVEPVTIISSNHSCTNRKLLAELRRDIGLAAKKSSQVVVYMQDDETQAYLVPPDILVGKT